jgi:hypothetical protein
MATAAAIPIKRLITHSIFHALIVGDGLGRNAACCGAALAETWAE